MAWRVSDGDSWVPAYASTRWAATRFHPNVGRDVRRADIRVTRLPQLDGVGGLPRELSTRHVRCQREHDDYDNCSDPYCWEGETVDWPETVRVNTR